MKPALLIVDMTIVFTTGRLGSAKARAIIPAVRRTLQAARRVGVPAFYVQDWHSPRDPEMRVWGRHSMAGTAEAKIHPALTPAPGELVVHKHSLSLFHRTRLDRLLRARGVDTLVLVGVATEYCIQHGAADGHFRGYRVIVLKDCTAGLTPAAHRYALAYMRKAYGTQILSSASWRRGLVR